MVTRRRDATREAVERKSFAQEARLAWVKDRVRTIHQSVTTYDVLRRGGVELRHQGDDREEQFSCPFHGQDRRPSARVFPESARSPSHAWCYVCQERWDAITLWRKFNGMGEDAKFSQVLASLERAFNVQVPRLSEEAILDEDPFDEALDDFEDMYAVCESRLREARPAYRYFDDLRGFLSAGSVLDKLRHKVDNRLLRPERATEILRQLLNKIGDKERACPEG